MTQNSWTIVISVHHTDRICWWPLLFSPSHLQHGWSDPHLWVFCVSWCLVVSFACLIFDSRTHGHYPGKRIIAYNSIVNKKKIIFINHINQNLRLVFFSEIKCVGAPKWISLTKMVQNIHFGAYKSSVRQKRLRKIFSNFSCLNFGHENIVEL